MSMKFTDIESLRLCGIFPVGKEPSIRTLRSWTKWGMLPHYKVGHFVYYDEKEVTEYFSLKFRVSVVDIHKLRARAEKAEGRLKELVAYASALEDQLDSVGVEIARTAMKEDAK
jgi:hypothetical protein